MMTQVSSFIRQPQVHSQPLPYTCILGHVCDPDLREYTERVTAVRVYSLLAPYR